MKLDVVRLPLLSALVWLLAVVVTALVWGHPLATEAAATTEPPPLGDLLQAFQLHFPVWSKVIAALLIVLGSIRVGRITVRYGLYPINTSLAIPLYGWVACGILIGQNYLAEITAAYLLLVSTRCFFAGYRNGFAIGLLFRASFYLGLLPLIYAPTLVLPLLIIPAALCFRRTLRETFVALCGVILPTLVVCYIAWARGSSFLETPLHMWNALWSDSGYRIFEHTTLLSPALLGVVLFTVLCALFFSIASARTQSQRAKAILLYTAILFITTAALAFLPSATPGLLALIALPAAIGMPQTFVRIHRTAGTWLFLLLFGGCIANIALQ